MTTPKDTQEPSPAKLYATSVGALLVVGGIVGFFYSASFGAPGKVDDAIGLFDVNGWHNVFYVLTGAIGLLVAGFAARRYALTLGLLFLAIAIWGFILGGGESILGFFPVNGGDDFLHLALGLLGVGAALGTPKHRDTSSASRPGVPAVSKPQPAHRDRKASIRDAHPASLNYGRIRPAESPQAALGLRPAAAAHLEQHQGAGGDAAGADGDHGTHPVAGVAKGAQLALGERLGPVGELLGRRLGDRPECVLHPPREPLGRLDRPQRVGQHSLDVSHRPPPSPPEAA